MLLTLHISKIEPGNYRVLVLDGREEVDQWEAPNVAAAIRQWAERFRPEAFSARFEDALRRAWNMHQHNCDVAASDPGEMPELSA